jgi:group I intron endonuclease
MAHKRITGIYRITNTLTGRHYVGSADSIRARWVQHRMHLRNNSHHSAKLQRSWNKHGAEAFEFAIVQELPDRAGIIEREQHWIDALHGYTAGYNACATAGSTTGLKLTPEQRAAQAAARALRPKLVRSPEHRALMAENARGVVFTQERKDKIGAAAKARWARDYEASAAPIKAANTGRAWSDETRAKIMAARADEWTPERRAAASERAKARKHTPEAKAKIAASNARRAEAKRAKAHGQ